MHQSIAKYQDQTQGVLSDFDRMVLRGSLRRLNYGKGMEGYLEVPGASEPVSVQAATRRDFLRASCQDLHADLTTWSTSSGSKGFKRRS
jgi:hypothetical protein